MLINKIFHDGLVYYFNRQIRWYTFLWWFLSWNNFVFKIIKSVVNFIISSFWQCQFIIHIYSFRYVILHQQYHHRNDNIIYIYIAYSFEPVYYYSFIDLIVQEMKFLNLIEQDNRTNLHFYAASTSCDLSNVLTIFTRFMKISIIGLDRVAKCEGNFFWLCILLSTSPTSLILHFMFYNKLSACSVTFYGWW